MPTSGIVTSDQVIKLLEQVTDQAWLAGHKASPEGQAFLRMMGDIAEYVSIATFKQIESGMLSLSPGAAPGVCVIKAHRVWTNAGAQFIPKGYKFRLDTGIELVLVQDVVIADAQTDVILPLVTLRKLDMVNCFDPAFAPLLTKGDPLFAAVSPDSPDITYAAGGHPEWLLIGSYLTTHFPGTVANDATLIYDSSTNIIGAQDDWLLVLGSERGQRRQANEDDAAYRARVRNIPDAVSPKAIVEAVNAAASQVGLSEVWMLEPFYDGADPDLRAEYRLSTMDGPFCDGFNPGTGKFTEFLDDAFGIATAGKLPFCNYELPSIREARAYFRLLINGPMQDPDDMILYASVGDESVVVDFVDDEVYGFLDVGLQPEYLAGVFGTGIHPKLQASLMAIMEEVNRKRAAGVNFDLYVENAVKIHGNDLRKTAGWDTPFALQADPAIGWFLRYGFISCCIKDIAWNEAAYKFKLMFFFTDGSPAFTTPEYTQNDSVSITHEYLNKLGFPHSKFIRSIVGLVFGDGAHYIDLEGTFWVDEFTL